MNHDVFLFNLDQLIQSKHLLNHPFYQAWSKGELSIECLKEYAKEYYHHVQAFPTYLSALHSHTENASMRRALLKNLIEEEDGSPNHPELWKNFALALGVQAKEMENHVPNNEIKSLISVLRQICKEGTTAEGLAALYAYESQIPAICVSKIDGLKKHYGMNHPQGWEYFRVHIAADEEHAADERQMLQQTVTTANSEMVMAAADQVLDALWNFLSGLCHKHGIVCVA